VINFLPVLLKDFYKVQHKIQYPSNTTLIYSNLTPRSSRIEGIDSVVAFGYQYFVKEYLQRQFDLNFFERPRDAVVAIYKRRIDNALGPGTDCSHIGELHELGYLPLSVKAVPEGTLVPLRVPVLTIRNTDPKFFWLTNMLETLLSNVLWMASTSATTAFRYRKTFEEYAKLTGADPAFIPWQGHDFSFRGMSGVEAACLSGAGHLLSFTGTDTIPAIDFLEEYYGANSDTELVGGSVPATEHSVMCMGEEDGEFETFKRLITETYPTGIVSVVSDTWDFWKVLTDYLPRLRDVVKGRDGKLVIRPDSGDPVKIICGDPTSSADAARKGAIRVLYEVFGGSSTRTGHLVLDPHIGLIYGDSITPERQTEILSRLAASGFASSNVVLGIGSYTYQHVTRDTYGWAMKATYGELLDSKECVVTNNTVVVCDKKTRGCARIHTIPKPIFKSPKTDNGVKNSAKGLLMVNSFPLDNGGQPRLIEDVSWSQEATGLLKPIYLNGAQYNTQTLGQIRARLLSYL
jgi:nicotinamide phosphoribosyltransferase